MASPFEYPGLAIGLGDELDVWIAKGHLSKLQMMKALIKGMDKHGGKGDHKAYLDSDTDFTFSHEYRRIVPCTSMWWTYYCIESEPGPGAFKATVWYS